MDPSGPTLFIAPSLYRATELEGEPLVYSKGIIKEIDQPNENIFLKYSTVRGNVIGKSIKVQKANIEGRINSPQGNIWVNKCQSLTHLEATGGSILARLCRLETATAKGSIELYQSTAHSVSAKSVTLIVSNAVTVTAESDVELINSGIKHLTCTAVTPKSRLIINKCKIGILRVCQATESPTSSSGTFTSVKRKPVIQLKSSKVHMVIFEEGVEGKVILIGPSSVQKVVNGIARRMPLSIAPESSEGCFLEAQSSEMKDPEKE